MKVLPHSVAGLWEPALGYDVILNQSEKRTLERAGEILHRLREHLDSESEMETDVALAAYTCQEIATEPVRADRSPA